MKQKANNNLDAMIEIPNLGQFRVVSKAKSIAGEQNNLEVFLTFIPERTKDNKVEFTIIMNADGEYKIFDNSMINTRIDYFDGLGLA